MSDEIDTTTTEAPAVAGTNGKPKAKPTARKAPAKKPAAKLAAEAKGPADRSAADVPVGHRRLALVKLLRRLGATTQGSARPVAELAQKLGYTNYDVYCLAYHKFHLAVAGLVKTSVVEGQRGLSVYLTTKGQKATDEQVAG